MPPSAPTVRAPSPASWPTWLIAVLLAVNLAWTTLGLGGYRPETKLVSYTLTAVAVVVLLAQRAARETAPRWHPFGYAFLPFLAYGLVNVGWVTPVPWLGWMDWLGWAQGAAAVWLGVNVLGARGPRRLVLGTVWGLGIVAVGLALYQTFGDETWLMLGRTQSYQFAGRASGPFGIPNSLAALLVLLLPATLALAVRPGLGARARALAVVAAAAFGFGLVLTVSRGAWLALVLALAAWPLLRRNLTWPRRLAWSAGVLALAAAAGGLAYGVHDGVRARLDAFVADGGERTRPVMWRGAWALFEEQPLTGTGAGSYNVRFERHRPEGFRDDPQWAHNDYLNTLSDYGLVGFVLAFPLPAAVAAWLKRRSDDPGSGATRRPLAVGLLAFGLTLLVDFHLKLPALVLVAGIVLSEWIRPAGAPRGRRRQGRAVRLLAGLAAGALAVAFVAGPLPRLRAEAERYGARRMLDGWAEGRLGSVDGADLVAQAQARFGRAVLLDPANAQAWSDLSYALSLAARFQPSAQLDLGGEAGRAAHQALALAPDVAEFWWRLGVAADMQAHRDEAAEAFARALQLAPRHPLAWYHQAYHYSLSPVTLPLARAALATCLRLDPGYAPAEALLAEIDSVR